MYERMGFTFNQENRALFLESVGRVVDLHLEIVGWVIDWISTSVS
jgi:hypothetical protein